MADSYPVHTRQLANGDLQFFNPATGNAVLTFSVALNGLPLKSVANGLTAHAGGGQASALVLAAQCNQISTVGTAADSVVLPPAIAGAEISVTNNAAANAANVYPASATQGGVAGGDAINALGVNAAFSLAANKTALFICNVTGTWAAVLTA